MAKRILLVEDEENIARVTALRLKSVGYELLLSKDGEEGLQKAKETFPDLVLLDINMPKMDGFAVCRELKKDPLYQNIPIIMFTARQLESDLAKVKEVGADGYMSKPYTSEDLLAKVKEFFE